MTNVLKNLTFLTGLLSLGAVEAIAAPVLWAPRPGGIVANGEIAPTDDAETLDQLTAPLSADQMGWTTDLNFRTTFDEDIDELREKNSPEAADDAPEVQDGIIPNPLARSPGLPTLRYVPTLRSAPEF